MDNSPFDQGVVAATDGLPASANPFPEGSDANASWVKGYHSIADQRDEDGSTRSSADLP
jgi:hypothetical protein